MTYELLMQLLHGRSFFYLAFVLVFMVLNWLIHYSVIFKMLKVKVPLTGLYPLALTSGILSFCSRPFLPGSWFGPLTAMVTIVLVVITKKIHLIRAAWAVMLNFLLNAIGPAVIISVLCAFSQSLVHFFFETYWGLLAGITAESVFSVLALLILHKFKNISLIPPFKDKFDLWDTVAGLTYASMFYIVYFAYGNLFINLMNNYQHALKSVWFLVIAATSNVLGTVLLFRNMKTKNVKLEEDRKLLENERNKLAEDKERITEEKNRINEEKNQILQEKIHLEEEKSKLEEEKGILLSRVEELINLNNTGESIESQKYRGVLLDIYEKTRNSLPPDIQIDDDSISKEQSILNIISGKENEELKKILGVTNRELDVLHLIAQGRSNKEMDSLDLAEGTVRNLVSGLNRKFKTRDRNQLMTYIIQYLVAKE